MKSDSLSLRQRLGLEIFRKLENEKIKEHPLNQLFWECTLRCNLHCRHCGSDCKKIAGQPDMPLQDFLRVLDNVALYKNPNQVFISITGGEPLMRKDLEECGREITKRGFPWGMVTNGFFLTQQRLDALMKSGLRSIAISLDGFATDHNWMRGNSESYDHAIEAIKTMIAEPNLIFDIVTCINKHSFLRLKEMKEFLIGLGVKHWRIFTIFPVGRATEDSDLQLSNQKMREVMEFIRQTRSEGRIHLNYGCEGFLGNYEGKVRDNLFSCHAGITVGSVLIDGSISACPSIRADYHQGNIYKGNFMDVWNEKFLPYRDRTWMKKDECGDCKYFSYCKGSGMHLRDEEGKLLFCHLKRLKGE